MDALKEELEDKTDKARKLIQFLNNKDTKYLGDAGIKDRTMVIMQANMILAKHRLMEMAELKLQGMTKTNYNFRKIFDVVEGTYRLFTI